MSYHWDERKAIVESERRARVLLDYLLHHGFPKGEVMMHGVDGEDMAGENDPMAHVREHEGWVGVCHA